ncbi:hypothetical protein RP20_CCG011726 [Aedes albopictus]|nr:hypothetical protein RP20_CCG011726 [Aedes albopictus]
MEPPGISLEFKAENARGRIAPPQDFVIPLKDVRVSVPAAIRRGDNANLICDYDMEGDTLYSVKWYKGKREFFRYRPKENPSLKTFPVLGITVEDTRILEQFLTEFVEESLEESQEEIRG